MKKTTKNFGNVFTVEEETLTDGSKVYNVKHVSTTTSFDCVDYSHATKLFKELERCVVISVGGALISPHTQKKIDALREQIAQADEVNDTLRKKIVDQEHAIQGRDGSIAFRDDAITRRSNIIIERDEKIKNLRRGIKELSDRYQESQHQEIKLGKELEQLKSRIRNLAVDKEDS